MAYKTAGFSDKLYITVILLLYKESFVCQQIKHRHIENEYLEKMRYLAKRETRSLSNLLEHLCKLYIEKYEQDHGKIEMENAEKED